MDPVVAERQRPRDVAARHVVVPECDAARGAPARLREQPARGIRPVLRVLRAGVGEGGGERALLLVRGVVVVGVVRSRRPLVLHRQVHLFVDLGDHRAKALGALVHECGRRIRAPRARMRRGLCAAHDLVGRGQHEGDRIRRDGERARLRGLLVVRALQSPRVRPRRQGVVEDEPVAVGGLRLGLAVGTGERERIGELAFQRRPAELGRRLRDGGAIRRPHGGEQWIGTDEEILVHAAARGLGALRLRDQVAGARAAMAQEMEGSECEDHCDRDGDGDAGHEDEFARGHAVSDWRQAPMIPQCSAAIDCDRQLAPMSTSSRSAAKKRRISNLMPRTIPLN